MGQREPQVRGDEVLPLHRRRIGVPARRRGRVGVPAPVRRPGILTFDYRVLAEWTVSQSGLSTSTEAWLFFGFMAAFAIKVPLVPFHTWLPDVHTEAPTAGSVVLAGVILKMGAYGILRFAFGLFPDASVEFAPLFITLGVIGIVYGSIVAAMQKDAKRVIAYSSVAHMGFIVLGIFSLTVYGLDGAAFTMVSHPLTTGALFLVVGMLYERRHTRQIDQFGGIWKSAPKLTALFLIALFAGIGLPGFSGFVGEFLSLLGAFLAHRWWAIVATTGRHPRRGLHALDVPAGLHRGARR